MKNKYILMISAGLFLTTGSLFAQQRIRQKDLSCLISSTRMEADAQEPAASSKEDIELPEAETFLRLAAEEMAKYHRTHKTYAAQWDKLNFEYAYPTYHTSDPDIRPSSHDGNRWKPRGSHFVYVIAFAKRNVFLIKAQDNTGKTAYELRQGLLYPTPIDSRRRQTPPHK